MKRGKLKLSYNADEHALHYILNLTIFSTKEIIARDYLNQKRRIHIGV